MNDMKYEATTTASSCEDPACTGKRTYTVDEIQDILEISRTTAYKLVKQNLFRSVRIGGSIRISKKSFDAWLDSQL